MDDRLHVSCVSDGVVCVQPAHRKSGRSLHLINKSVKKRSTVCLTVQTKFGDLKVCLTSNSKNEVGFVEAVVLTNWTRDR